MVGHTSFRRMLEGYLEEKEKVDELKPRTIREYRRVNLNLEAMLRGAGMKTHPLEIGMDEVQYIRAQYPPVRGSYSNQRSVVETLMSFMRWCGNPNLAKVKLRWPKGVRIHVDWLSAEEMEAVRESVMDDPEQALVFHLAGDLALRRCEIMRLTEFDVDGPTVHVLGKGRGDGKPRDVMKRQDTNIYIADYLDRRSDLVRKAMGENPLGHVPTRLIIAYHPYQRRLVAPGTTAMDNRIKEMSTKAGVRFRYHTLRRTCAREWFLSGGRLETISDMLGHSDIRTTIAYLGLQADDQVAVHQLRMERQTNIRASKGMNPSLARLQETTGPNHWA